MRKSTLKRFVRQPKFAEHLELHRLDCSASHGHLDAYEDVQVFLAETPPEQVRPPRLLTGDDLVGMGFRQDLHFRYPDGCGGRPAGRVGANQGTGRRFCPPKLLQRRQWPMKGEGIAVGVVGIGFFSIGYGRDCRAGEDLVIC